MITPPYEIATTRLRLRPWGPSDAEGLAAALDEGLRHLQRWLSWARSEPIGIAERESVLRRFRGYFDIDRDYLYGLFSRESGEVLGGVGLHPRQEHACEIGYWVKARALGHGYALEATSALTKVGFEMMNLLRVEIRSEVNNTHSSAIPAALGFVREGVIRSSITGENGEMRDLEIWGILRSEFARSAAALSQIEAYDVMARAIRPRETF